MKAILQNIHDVCRPHQLFISYFFVGFFLFLYSFSQVDLGLTLTKISIWQKIQQSFQYIGYFQRPLSSLLFICIVFSLFLLYGLTLKSIRNHHISYVSFWALILFIFVLLIFSYPAFSYDFFNYMFTAKTVVLYHKNPYAVVPLQFTGYESWLSFMHWTHLPSAYAPVWIALTLPPYLFGFGYFLLILWNIKLLIGISYLLGAWAISDILSDEKEEYRLMGVALYALNPLILIESLVSGHNDMVMIGIALLALAMLKRGRILWSFFFLSFSIALKEITLILLPLFIYRKQRWLPFLCMLCGLLGFLIFFKRELLPWYGIWVIPFIALVPYRIFVMPLLFGFSFGLLLSYAPFLYYGHWNNPVPLLRFWIIVSPMIGAGFLTLWLYYRSYVRKKMKSM